MDKSEEPWIGPGSVRAQSPLRRNSRRFRLKGDVHASRAPKYCQIPALYHLRRHNLSRKKKLVFVILPQKLGAQHFRVNTICIITLSKNDVPSASHEEASDSVAARSQRPKDSCVPGLWRVSCPQPFRRIPYSAAIPWIVQSRNWVLPENEVVISETWGLHRLNVGRAFV